MEKGEKVFNKDEKEKEITSFDVAVFKAEAIFKVDTTLQEKDAKEHPIQNTLAVFPTYIICKIPFLLMDDIQLQFELREDQCLGTFSQWLEMDRGFIDHHHAPLMNLILQQIDSYPKSKLDPTCFLFVLNIDLKAYQ